MPSSTCPSSAIAVKVETAERSQTPCHVLEIASGNKQDLRDSLGFAGKLWICRFFCDWPGKVAMCWDSWEPEPSCKECLRVFAQAFPGSLGVFSLVSGGCRKDAPILTETPVEQGT